MAPLNKTTASSRAALPRVLRRALALALVGAAVLAAPAAALQLGPPDPHSPNTEDMATAYWVMIAVTLVVLVAINAALLTAILRFRARRGRTAARITAGRGVIGRIAGALGVIAAAILVFGIVVAGNARTVGESGAEGLTAAASRTAQTPIKGVSQAALEAADEQTLGQEPPGGETAVFKPAEGDPLVISAIAQQWLWRFEYPGGTPGQKTFSYGELVVPVDTAVVLNIDSTDVVHSWWVPELTGQVQAVPGTISRTWFKADETGVYEGQGTVFDGTMYPALTAKVRVVEAAEYEAHVEELAADLAEAQAIVRDEAQAAAALGAPSTEGQAP